MIIIYSFNRNINTQKTLVNNITSARLAGLFVITTGYKSFLKD
jgi:hypothetical protein